MSINRKCPQCGSNYVQLSNEKSKYGFFWFLIFGIFYILYIVFIKWLTGIVIFLFYDIWMFIVKKVNNKVYVWQCVKWFSINKRIFYCHNCGYNFKA